MPVAFDQIKRLLEEHRFGELFNQIGWDWPASDSPYPAEVDGVRYDLQPVSRKRGFIALHCPAMPDSATRAKIESRLSRDIREHLVIFTDPATRRQRWQWVRRTPGQPLSRKEHEYLPNQPRLLIEKLNWLEIGMDEEGNLDIIDVADKVKSAFDIDKVTKRFYERFRKEHEAFLGFVVGIADMGDARWYASVMLNRLMFIYFIQKKNLLDGDPDYLRNRLRQVQTLRGKGQFQTFYRYFLRTLCHEALGKKERNFDPELSALIGRVPYLNGGIFLPHELEDKYGAALDIPDEAFERIFDFFDQYEWHLDNRPASKPDEINPDVLGYIFEKYINQKQMGAYYTKEDITEYIARNTIIPCLFDKVRKSCKIAFEGRASVWNHLSADPDRYIYPAVRHGVTFDMVGGQERDTPVPYPPDIEIGLDTAKPNLLERRKRWNTPAPPEAGLPTEIWRETVARRQRYADIKGKLERGEVRSVNDMVTLNLDIRQFAQDVIERCESPDLLNAFWVALAGRLPQNSAGQIKPGITVLDPTCGSGAFLFAALNILEPLYEACLDRMRDFLEEWGDRPGHSNYAKFFCAIRADIGRHPSPKYFIYKSIIIHNLYGVDIMKEAVEICKLRLFLKLAAQVDDGDRIEPLPDIDFNIRAGNTLVGFATEEDMKQAMRGDLLAYQTVLPEIVEDAEECDKLYNLFRQSQLRDDNTLPAAKSRLSEKLHELNDRLNMYLAQDYGVDVSKIMGAGAPSASQANSADSNAKQQEKVAEPRGSYAITRKTPYRKWLASHQPFHWFIEFYGIAKTGGFDTIIGNPPYIAATKVRKEYALRNYATDKCPDIYANVMERVTTIVNRGGRTGMIVPLSITFSGEFADLRQHIFKRYGLNWFASFARIPAALFSADVRVRNTIHIGLADSDKGKPCSTVLHRWFEEARPHLFANLRYAPYDAVPYKGLVPKLGSAVLARAFETCLATTKKTMGVFFSGGKTEHVLYFKKSAYNWLNFCRKLPPCFDSTGKAIEHTQFGAIAFRDAETRDLAFLLLNGKLMFSFWAAMADDFHLATWTLAGFPIDLDAMSATIRSRLLAMPDKLEAIMEENTSFKLNAGKRIGNYNLAKCRHFTDQSDLIFASILGIADHWQDIELMYTQIVKTDFTNDNDSEA